MGEPAGHYVICAYGRVGRAVMEELRRRDYTVVVIEAKPELEPLLEEHGVPYVSGDPADETVLTQAGIERARGLMRGGLRRGQRVHHPHRPGALDAGLPEHGLVGRVA